MKINSYKQFKSQNKKVVDKNIKKFDVWTIFFNFQKNCLFQLLLVKSPKRIQIKKNSSRQNQQRLSNKIGPRNRISKNVMEICGDGNSNKIHFLEYFSNKVRLKILLLYLFRTVGSFLKGLCLYHIELRLFHISVFRSK